MAKPWDEKPLWWKCYLGAQSKVYLHAGRIIGHRGCSGFAFYDAAKLLPFYDKLRFENAVRDLCVTLREQAPAPGYAYRTPEAFVDFCEQARDTGSPDEEVARRVQRLEWQLLFD